MKIDSLQYGPETASKHKISLQYQLYKKFDELPFK